MQSRGKGRRRNVPKFRQRSLKTLVEAHPKPSLSPHMRESQRRGKGKSCCQRLRMPLIGDAGGLSTARRWVKARPRPLMDMALSPLQSSACRGGALWMGPLQVRIDSNQVMLLFGFAAVDCGRDGSQVKSSQNQCVCSDQSASVCPFRSIRLCFIAGETRVG